VVTDCFDIAKIKARAVRLRAEYGIRLFVYDYLQIITSPGQNREAEVANAFASSVSSPRNWELPISCCHS
jgi:replicative DNA helicase